MKTDKPFSRHSVSKSVTRYLALSLELAAIILLRNKRRKFKDTPLFGAFIGITLSIIPLVLVLEVSDSMIFGIMNRYIETLYSHIMLRFYAESDLQKKENLKTEIDRLPGVRTSYYERSGTALLLAKTARSAVQVRALENRAFAEDTGLTKYLSLTSGGSLNSDSLHPGTILLASDVAFRLQIEPGDEVALVTGARFQQGITGFSGRGKVAPKGGKVCRSGHFKHRLSGIRPPLGLYFLPGRPKVFPPQQQ